MKMKPKKKRKYNFYFSVINNAIEFVRNKLETIPNTSEDKQLARERRKLTIFINTYKTKRERVKKKAEKKGYI